MVYALKTQRLTTRKLLKDRFLSCQVHPSSEEQEGYAGCLFSLIEIDNKQYSITQIGHSIINTTAREYFRHSSDSVSENFELALKKTNEILANYTQEGQTEWIGNLHGLIALIYKDEIHLACVSNAYALLIRNGKLSNIAPDCANENDVHPLCTFSNITSGPLEKNDIVVLASKNLFSHISKKDLRQLLEINSLEESSIELGHLLAEQKTFDTNVLLIETTTKQDLANEPLSSVPDSVYLDELSDTLSRKIRQFHQKSFLPALSNCRYFSLKCFSNLYNWLKQKNTPEKIQKFTQSLAPLLKSLNIKKKTAAEKISPEDFKPQSHPKIHHYHKFKFTFPKLPLYPVIIGCLVVILIFSLLFKINHNKPKTTQKSTDTKTKTSQNLANLQTKFSLAKSASNSEAITLYEEIINNLSNQKLTAQQTSLLNQTEQKYSELTKSQKISIPQTFKLPEKNLKIAVFDTNIYGFGQKTIYKSPVNDTTFTKTTKLAAASGDIVDITGPTSQKTFILMTRNQKMLEYSPQKNELTELTTTGPWKTGSTLASFNKNLYILDPTNQQIWKYTPKTTNYNQATAFLSTSDNLVNNFKSFAIDGSLFAIDSQSKLYRLQKSAISEIKYTKIPTPSLTPTNTTSLVTSPDSDYFFVTEAQKITLFTKQGQYVKQYRLSEPISDIYAQSVLKKLWIATDGYLFSINY